MHTYKVYEVDSSGNKIDTGNTVEWDNNSWAGYLVHRVCALYGFDRYVNLYTCNQLNSFEYMISFNYQTHRDDTWVVKRGQ